MQPYASRFHSRLVVVFVALAVAVGTFGWALPQAQAAGVSGGSGVVAYNTSAGMQLVDVAAGASAGGLGASGQSVAFSADSRTAYVSAPSSLSVLVVSIATRSVTASIAIPSGTEALAMSPDGAELYAAGSYGLLRISTVSQTVQATSIVSSVSAMVIAADGSHVYLSSGTDILVYAVATDTFTTVAFGSTSGKLAISPDSSTLYGLTTGPGGSVSTLVLASTTITHGPPIGAFPFDFALTPDGSTLFVADFNYGNPNPLLVVSPTTLAVTDQIAGLGSQRAVAISPDGKTLAVVQPNANKLSLIDVASRAVAQTLSIPPASLGQAFFLPDVAPVAAFSETGFTAGSATSFDASASTVFPGQIASYIWSFGDGATATTTGPTVSHTYAAAGNYTVTLRAVTTAGTTVGTSQYFGRYALRTGSSAAAVSAQVAIAAAAVPGASSSSSVATPTATGAPSTPTASGAPSTSTASPSSRAVLAATGFDAGPWLLLAVMLCLIGAGLMVLVRLPRSGQRAR